MPSYNILISDGLDERGQSILRASANVDYHQKISAEDLLKMIPEYDALIVRGQTRVTAAVIEVGTRLQVIGRAGVGVEISISGPPRSIILLSSTRQRQQRSRSQN